VERRSVVEASSSVEVNLIVRSTVGRVTTVKASTDDATVNQLLDAPLTEDAPLLLAAAPITGGLET